MFWIHFLDIFQIIILKKWIPESVLGFSELANNCKNNSIIWYMKCIISKCNTSVEILKSSTTYNFAWQKSVCVCVWGGAWSPGPPVLPALHSCVLQTRDHFTVINKHQNQVHCISMWYPIVCAIVYEYQCLQLWPSIITYPLVCAIVYEHMKMLAILTLNHHIPFC